MRPLLLLALATPLMLVACGGDDPPQRVYVAQPGNTGTPMAGTTVVVPPGSSAKICPVGTVC